MRYELYTNVQDCMGLDFQSLIVVLKASQTGTVHEVDSASDGIVSLNMNNNMSGFA